MTSYEDVIREVALKNRYSVKETDTVMALVTILNKLAMDWESNLNAVLEHHKGEHETIANRWRKEATKRAEVIVNASLSAGREAMAKGMSEGAVKVLELVRQDTREDLRVALAAHEAGMQNTVGEFKRYVNHLMIGSGVVLSLMVLLTVLLWR